jgi:hypothetical protein
MSELNGKIISIQQHLKAPKNQFNSFGKYKYRSCEDILEGVKPLLHDAGLVQTITDEIVNVGNRYYIKATVSVSDGENTVQVTAFAREPESKKGMDESQITGTASSYARKYALNGMWLIDDTKDADTDEHTNQVKKGKPTLQTGTKKWIEAVDKVASGKATIDVVKKHYEIDENAFNAEVRQRQEDATQ